MPTQRVLSFLNLRRDEVAPTLLAGFYFFCVLTALGVLRPARDAIGMRNGLDEIRWLFIGTALVTLAVNPMFGWLVSRFRRMTFITVAYVLFAVSLAGFFLLITMAPAAVGETSGRVFYVWFSVFNLFSTMVFWALMADRFSLAQSKRLFGVIAVGGTLGAIAGPALARLLVGPLGTPALMLVSAALLLVAVGAAWMVASLQPEAEKSSNNEPSTDRAIIGGNAWDGIRAVFQSRYLLGISGYVLILTVMSTFIYLTRLQMVAALGADLDMRTGVLAQLDTITQLVTLALQLFVSGHIMKRFGVGTALVLLPVTVALGFVGLAIVASLTMLVVIDATFRAVMRAVTRPARKTLFTVVGREEKYKSKAFTDTFVYRGGDVLGAWTESGIGSLGLGLMGLASAVVPLAALWGILGVWLGRSQESMVATPATGRRDASVEPAVTAHASGRTPA